MNNNNRYLNWSERQAFTKYYYSANFSRYMFIAIKEKTCHVYSYVTN